MPCGCKNKQNAAAQKPAVQKPSNPLNNRNVGGIKSGRRVEKRIIR